MEPGTSREHAAGWGSLDLSGLSLPRQTSLLGSDAPFSVSLALASLKEEAPSQHFILFRQQVQLRAGLQRAGV